MNRGRWALGLAVGAATALVATLPASAHTAHSAGSVSAASTALLNAHHRPGGTHDNSTDSAGYGAIGSAHAFTTVEAHWTVPTVTCSATTQNSEIDLNVGLNDWSLDNEVEADPLRPAVASKGQPPPTTSPRPTR